MHKETIRLIKEFTDKKNTERIVNELIDGDLLSKIILRIFNKLGLKPKENIFPEFTIDMNRESKNLGIYDKSSQKIIINYYICERLAMAEIKRGIKMPFKNVLENIIVHTFIHELLHHLSSFEKKSGIEDFFNNNAGQNEALTELISEYITEKYFRLSGKKAELFSVYFNYKNLFREIFYLILDFSKLKNTDDLWIEIFRDYFGENSEESILEEFVREVCSEQFLEDFKWLGTCHQNSLLEDHTIDRMLGEILKVREANGLGRRLSYE